MTLPRALVIACLLILPGVVLRVAPYLDRVVERVVDREAPATHADAQLSPATSEQSIPSRLSQRPLRLVVAGFAVEVAVYVMCITLLLRSHWLLALFGAAPWAQQAVYVCFFATLLAGFLAGSQSTFPFVAWRMYSGIAEEPPSAYVVTGVTRSGKSVRLDLGEVLPMLGTHRGYNLVISRVAADDDSELSAALVAAGRLYNLQHPAEPVERLSVSFMTIPLDNHEPPWIRDERIVASVTVQ